MFKSLLSLALVAVAAVSAQTTPAPDPVFKFGTPTYFGSGCPKDTLMIIPSTDGQSVSVLFSEFRASTSINVTRERKSCNLAVPVDIKPGVSVGVFRVDYRGNVYVPKIAGASAQFDAEYYFAGQRGPVALERYANGTSKDLYVTNAVPVGAIVWSPCGASTIFRINSAVTAFKPQALRDGEEVQIAIDSVDSTIEHGFRYFLTTRACPQ
ncbi:hypothetical protein P43SY_003701 [Pythium insidiosum]|uniref:DUF4360 domain-containing protein n=1 Tax=Pythium insidiosum TaxID=114742 RepID=A0AAD5LII8_PYTIN|nr:hypothetical protein P43SY_003701 [Pythium insidiosum]KAJ0402276.1 hypothetical protein ATCC90586_005103 [Pythium insidiosum]